MTLKDVLKGKKITVVRTAYKETAIVRVPRKFLRKAHDEVVNEDWVRYDVKDCGSRKALISIHTPADKFDTRFKLFVRDKRQKVDNAVMQSVYKEVNSLYQNQERIRADKLQERNRAHVENKKSKLYQQAFSTKQR